MAIANEGSLRTVQNDNGTHSTERSDLLAGCGWETKMWEIRNKSVEHGRIEMRRVCTHRDGQNARTSSRRCKAARRPAGVRLRAASRTCRRNTSNRDRLVCPRTSVSDPGVPQWRWRQCPRRQSVPERCRLRRPKSRPHGDGQIERKSINSFVPLTLATNDLAHLPRGRP